MVKLSLEKTLGYLHKYREISLRRGLHTVREQSIYEKLKCKGCPNYV